MLELFYKMVNTGSAIHINMRGKGKKERACKLEPRTIVKSCMQPSTCRKKEFGLAVSWVYGSW